uniref:Tudor domain-containing protein n=1 Tax=Glossina brevipalpis TaxID=37001 RepID=A0A1A9WIA0_9MUSC
MYMGGLSDVKVIIKSLVLSSPESINVEQLNRDFKETEGEHIPFRQFEKLVKEQKKPRKRGKVPGHKANAKSHSHSRSTNNRSQTREIPLSTPHTHEQSSSLQNNVVRNVQGLTQVQLLARNFQLSRAVLKSYSQWPLMQTLPNSTWSNFYNYQLPVQNVTPVQPWNFTNQTISSTFTCATNPRKAKGISKKAPAAKVQDLEKFFDNKCKIQENATDANINAANKFEKPAFLWPTPATDVVKQVDEKSPTIRTNMNITNDTSKPSFLFPTPTQTKKQENENSTSIYAGINGENEFSRPPFLLSTPINVRKQKNVNSNVTYASINGVNKFSWPSTSVDVSKTKQVHETDTTTDGNTNGTKKSSKPAFLSSIRTQARKQINDNTKATSMISETHFPKPTIAQNRQQEEISSPKSECIYNESNEIQNNNKKELKLPSKLFSIYEDLIDVENTNGVTLDDKETTTLGMNVNGNISCNNSDLLNDLDEAVPECANNGFLFCLDFPNHLIPLGSEIPSIELSRNLHVGSYLQIYVTEIHSPFKFWFHIEPNSSPLDTLMYRIGQWYKRLNLDEMRIPIDCLKPGQVCAAPYENVWHRAIIVRHPVGNKVMVSFVDYGTVSEVDIVKIKYLTTNFCELPAQALRGCLSYVKPRQLHWSHEATNYFLSLVTETIVFAKISEINIEEHIFYLVICNTCENNVIQINTALIENRYASYDYNWEDCNIEKRNGKRLHHPREDFPTFEMLELGEYATLDELIWLDELGIDYEAIYDLLTCNTSLILNKQDDAPPCLRQLPFNLLSTNPFCDEIIFGSVIELLYLYEMHSHMFCFCLM